MSHYQEEPMGPTPEQIIGVAAGASLGLAALVFSVIRRRRRRKQTLAAKVESLRDHPALQRALASARDALESVDAKRLEAARRDLMKQAEGLPKTIRSDVEPVAREMAEWAKEIAERVRVEGSERSREFAERWQRDYQPAAKHWAEDAVHEAERILGRARERSGEFSDTARKDILPKVGPLAAAATGALATALSEGAERLTEQLKDSPATRVKKDLKKKVGRTQPSVVERTGSAVKDVTGQAIMIAFWGAALGAVIYYGLLNEERRERVRSFFTETAEQISELVEDFRDDAMEFAEEDERF